MSTFVYNGLHLLYDAGTGIPVQRGISSPMNDPSTGAKIINNIVETIDMTLIIPPLTVEFPHNKSELRRLKTMLEEEGLANTKSGRAVQRALEEREDQMYGWSSMAMVAESHITIHTFPAGGFVTADVYSCKEFDADVVVDMLDAIFFYSEGYSDSEIQKNVQKIKRGLDFSKMRK